MKTAQLKPILLPLISLPSISLPSFVLPAILLATAWLVFSGPCFAQKARPSLDQNIASRLKRLSEQQHQENFDKLNSKLNEEIRTLLVNAATKRLLTENVLKESKKEGLWIAQSPDRVVRIFSWDTISGGTAHSYQSVIQYKSETYFRAFEFNLNPKSHSDVYYSEIKQITVAGSTVYIAVGSGTESTDIFTETLEAFWLVNLTPTKYDLYPLKYDLFKKQKSVFSRIFVENRMNSDASVPGIEFTDHDKMVKVPLIDKELNDTGDFILYKFNGKNFVLSGSSN